METVTTSVENLRERSALRVALVGGIYGKPAAYRQSFRITPETTLEGGLREAGVHVFTFNHYAQAKGNYDILHVHHLSWGTLRAAVDQSSAAFVFTPHNGQDMAGTLSRSRRCAMGFAIRRADAVVSLSQRESQFLTTRYDTAGALTPIIPNGIDADQYICMRTNGAGLGGDWRLLYVGQLDPMKRVDLLLHAVARLDLPIVLNLVYQNANLEEELRALAEQLGIAARVHFLGIKNPTELCQLYNDADLFVLPSASEALPSVVTEAMLTGTPVIATDTGGVRTQLAGFGRLVVPNDLDGLTRSISEALSAYPDTCARAVEMSLYARQTFSRVTMIRSHLQLYESLLDGGLRRRQQVALRPSNLLLRGAMRYSPQPLAH